MSEANEIEPVIIEGITAILVSGFKSLASNYRIPIRPLTIFAGANSSGKSSVMQALLLLKQTLEATYDPGPLLIDGPNARFSSAAQFQPNFSLGANIKDFRIGLEVSNRLSFASIFRKPSRAEIRLIETRYSDGVEDVVLHPRMSSQAILSALPAASAQLHRTFYARWRTQVKWKIDKKRCFLYAGLVFRGDISGILSVYPEKDPFDWHLLKLIHVPGLRGNPERRY
ncbi:MAG TPA: AAA family ATPase, partial [Ardenticatenaceae bacterium]